MFTFEHVVLFAFKLLCNYKRALNIELNWIKISQEY